MKHRMVLADVKLPSFGCEAALPGLPVDVYAARLQRATDAMAWSGLDVLAVHADRERFANLAYLTGMDPRFEEVLLLLGRDGRRRLLVGNECMGFLPDVQSLKIEVELFQEFSLMGQQRDQSRPLRRILRDFGVRAGARVGAVGAKYFRGKLVGGAEALDVPAYLADLLRDLAGAGGRVVNATDLFMDPEGGLRSINEPEQIAQYEFAACVTSEAVRNVVRRMRPGVREQDLEPLLDGRGLPLSCHRMVSFGAKAARGLSSPSANVAAAGDAFTTALGVYGSLTARAGAVAAGPADLPPAIRTFYPRYAANYFGCVAAWYRALAVGARAGDVWKAAEAGRDRRLFSFAVNTGHLLHLDEWLHSPFGAGSRVVLKSGMMIQADIIPISRGPFCFTNFEDGVVLADALLRDKLAARYPAMWRRITRRRAFMQDVLGIPLDESVLPMGNTPAWHPPYAMASGKAFVCR